MRSEVGGARHLVVGLMSGEVRGAKHRAVRLMSGEVIRHQTPSGGTPHSSASSQLYKGNMYDMVPVTHTEAYAICSWS